MNLPEITQLEMAAWVEAAGTILAIMVTAIIAGGAEIGRRIKQARHRSDHARVTRQLIADVKRGLRTLGDAVRAANGDSVEAARTYLNGATQALHLLLKVRIEFGPSSQYVVTQSALSASLESLLADLTPVVLKDLGPHEHGISGKIIQADAFADEAARHV